MEQTIGKRIAEHRKRLGLTQDQLAAKLGVTAQAVSKWENDQSCPDISALPKLAEIFGISTDALLGREDGFVHEAEVVDDPPEDDHENPGIHIQNGNWEFQWKNGRIGAIMSAVFVLLVGCLTLLSRVMNWDVSFWSIVWPSAILILGLRMLLRRFSFSGLVCGILGGYYLIYNLGIWELNFGGELIFPALLVLFGISLLVDALKKPKKPHCRFIPKVKGHGETTESFSQSDTSFLVGLSFGESRREVSLPLLTYGRADCSFGNLVIDLSGCKKVAPGCHIDADCSFGSMTILVPKRFVVQPNADTNFSAYSVAGEPDAVPEGRILLNADISFGELSVRYI